MPEYEDEEFWKLAVRFEERKGTYLDVHRLWTLWKACGRGRGVGRGQ
jgi:hypothetical protein